MLLNLLSDIELDKVAQDLLNEENICNLVIVDLNAREIPLKVSLKHAKRGLDCAIWNGFRIERILKWAHLRLLFHQLLFRAQRRKALRVLGAFWSRPQEQP